MSTNVHATDVSSRPCWGSTYSALKCDLYGSSPEVNAFPEQRGQVPYCVFQKHKVCMLSYPTRQELLNSGHTMNIQWYANVVEDSYFFTRVCLQCFR